jgi:hypothetical protein
MRRCYAGPSVARKPRTPPPPRRVQAPKQRARTETPDERRSRLILFGVAASGIVGLVVAIGLFVFFGGGSASAADALEAANCQLQEVQASASAQHVQNPPPRSEYNTWPPTSGKHFPTPAPWDVYPEPVEQYRLVHDLEHGGIVIQYGDEIPQSTVEEILAWYREDPNGIVIAPYPELGNRIALEAWTAPDSTQSDEPGRAFLARCPTFDEDAFDAFKDAYGFRGPERFPRELLTPNS